MKLKLYTLALLAALAFQPSARAQTNSMDTSAAADQTATDTNMPASAAPVATADTTAVAEEPTNPPLAEVATSNEETTAAMAISNAPAAAETSAPAPASIPLIEFQDVPLDTAIENLARQANINYLLDPKISYGQAGQNGQVTPWPVLSIRWENVTAQQALLALLDNYDLELTQSPHNKIARISTKNPGALPPLITRVIQLKYASTSNMMESVEAVLSDRRSKVLPDVRTSQMVVVATQQEQDAVDTLVDQLDKPTRQVLIETKLVEISSDPTTAKGINWSGTLAAQHFTAGNNALPSQHDTNGNTTALGGLIGIPGFIGSLNKGAFLNPSAMFLNADGVSAYLSFLNSSYDAQVVSEPRVVTLDNETARISVTRGYPVINVTASTAGVSSGSSTITYSNIGTILEVTPRITANDYIWLNVVPEVSSYFNTITKIVAGEEYQADVFDDRKIDDNVMIPNANTLVMGGLVQDNPSASYTKVPVLGDIPVLGWAFRSENNSVEKDNLLIFITPTIVQDTDFQPTTTDFLKTQPRTMIPPVDPNKFWDSNKPYDWSNPKNTDPSQALINRTPE